MEGAAPSAAFPAAGAARAENITIIDGKNRRPQTSDGAAEQLPGLKAGDIAAFSIAAAAAAPTQEIRRDLRVGARN